MNNSKGKNIKMKLTETEKKECVQDYLSGVSKQELCSKWDVSDRSIERWLKRYSGNGIDRKMAKRSKVIPIDIQKELLKILDRNAILYGFKVSTWNEKMVIKFLKERYEINITKYLAGLLIKESKSYEKKDEDYEEDEVRELEQLGYNLFFLSKIKFGKIKSNELAPIYSSKFNAKMMNIDLVIIRAEGVVYIKPIFSPIKKTKDSKRSLGILNSKKYYLENNMDHIEKFILEIINKKPYMKNIIINGMEKPVRESKKIIYYNISEEIYSKFTKDKYESKKVKIVSALYNENNKYREFEDYYNIYTTIEDRIKGYIVELCKDEKLRNKEKNLEKSFKIIMD